MNQGKLEVVKQEMARVNIDILGIRELKWTGIGEFNSDDHYIYQCGQESLRRNGVALTVNKSLKCNEVSSLNVQLFATTWTVAHQALPSMGFSRQGYWSGLPFPSRMDLPHPGIKPRSPALQADSLLSEPQRHSWTSGAAGAQGSWIRGEPSC